MTQEAKHTPGPWIAVQEAGDEWWFGHGQQMRIRGENDPEWSHVAVLGGDTPAELADARLIAAAPELLEGGKVALGIVESLVASGELKLSDDLKAQVAALRAAIAKATAA